MAVRSLPPFLSYNKDIFIYFQIYDGKNSSAPLLNKLCGTTIPTSILTSGKSLYMRFVSDSSGVGNGFRALYQTVGAGKDLFV